VTNALATRACSSGCRTSRPPWEPRQRSGVRQLAELGARDGGGKLGSYQSQRPRGPDAPKHSCNAVCSGPTTRRTEAHKTKQGNVNVKVPRCVEVEGQDRGEWTARGAQEARQDE